MRIFTTGWYTLLLMLGTWQLADGQDKTNQDIPQPRKNYSNIISASPLPVTALDGATYFGAAIEYERFFDAKGYFSVNIPLFGGSIGLQKEIGTLYTVSPGLRYHPAGNARKLDFSFGPQVLLGREKYAVFEGQPTAWKNVTGLMFQTDLDWNMTRHRLLGVHLALGKYFDGGTIPGVAIQLGIKVGRCF